MSSAVHGPTSVGRAMERVTYLDGIRGWGALHVLFAHIMAAFLSASHASLKGTAFNFAYDAHFSVLVFFVLSGVALSVAPLRKGDRSLLAQAATARYFRLVIPILATSLIACAFKKAGLFFNVAAASVSGAMGWLDYMYNFTATWLGALKFSLYGVFFNYHTDSSYNSSLWTMTTEFAGSFLVFGYLALFRDAGRGANWVLATVTLFFLYSNPLLACFMIGLVIARLTMTGAGTRFGPVAQWLALATIPALVAVDTFIPPQQEVVKVLMSGAWVLAASISAPLQGFYGSRLSVFLGRISFPLYLIQIVVICSWSSWLAVRMAEAQVRPVVAIPLNLVSSVLLCALAAWLLLPVERMAVRWSRMLALAVVGTQPGAKESSGRLAAS